MQDKADVVQEVLGKAIEFTCYTDRIVIELPNEQDYEAWSISYDELVALSEKLGTRDINFEHESGDPGYSELTPGYVGSTYLVIRFPEEVK